VAKLPVFVSHPHKNKYCARQWQRYRFGDVLAAIFIVHWELLRISS
jgi:hypothetical protein